MLGLSSKSELSSFANSSVDEIKFRLLNHLESTLYNLLPNGKVYKNQFQVGNIHGDKGESLKVEMKGPRAGLWQDFATGESGDIFDLWGVVKGIDSKNEFPKLMDEIKSWLGIYKPFESQLYSNNKITTNNISSTTNAHTNDNSKKLVGQWDYLDKTGKNKLFTVRRYDNSTGGKDYSIWDHNKKDSNSYKKRPLYNLPGITESNLIILVEGEKCAQALIDQGICATTAMCGAKASLDKTDWAPLKGKDIIIWPDNDEVGKGFALDAYPFLELQGVASVKIIDIPIDKPDKWDAADSVREGIDVKAFIEKVDFIDTLVHDNDYIERIYDTDLLGDPPPMEWIIPGWMPKGEVGAIYGNGGLGKSLLVQQLMVALATGNEWLGFKREPIKVYGVICEDKKDEFHRRQHRIYKNLVFDHSDIKRNMVLIPRKGKDNTLMRFDKEERAKLSRFFENLLEDIKKFQPQLVVIDTLADTFGGNEIIRSQARQFIQSCCGKTAEETGATVLLCAHPSEAGLNKKSGTGGSTAWHNTLRFRWFIDKPEGTEFTEEMRTLALMKSNYSPCDGKFLLKLEKDGIFTVIEDVKVLSAAEKRSNKLEDLRDAKSNYILSVIHDEASAGRAYSICSFSRVFQNTGKPNLGSQRTLSDRLKDLAYIGYIRFFQNGEEYGLSKLANGNFGYMCVSNMRLKVQDKGLVLIKPTHHICKLSGNLKEAKGN